MTTKVFFPFSYKPYTLIKNVSESEMMIRLVDEVTLDKENNLERFGDQ